MTDIRIATREHLELISSDIQTAWEGFKYEPTKGTPYQEVSLLSGDVLDVGFDNIQVGNHILQVSLLYPSNDGTYDVEEKAKEIQSHFKKGTELTHGAIKVCIKSTPTIVNLGTIDDRIIRVVSINIKTGE